MTKHEFKHNNHTNIAFIATAVTLQALLTWLSYIAYQAWAAAFGVDPWTVGVIFIGMSFTFLTATLIAIKTENRIARAYYRVAAYWFAFIGPLFGAAAIFVVLERVFPLIGIIVMPFTAGVISFGIAFAIIIYGLWNATRVGTTRITLAIQNLPEAWRGKVIGFVSDIHLGDVRGRRFARKVVRRLNSMVPEIVLIGGDLFDGPPCPAQALIAPLQDLKAPHGVYAVAGNHEYLGDSERFFAAIKSANIRLLQNETVTIGGLQFCGVDFADADSREAFGETMKIVPIDRSAPSILVNHVPSHFDIAEQKGFNAYLAGHTHRGQFWPLSYITNYIFKGYDYGKKDFGTMTVYTSSGAGTWGPPFRLGTKSEVVMITLKNQDD